ncbi:MAG: L,D-transpeptidase family protein, partial [Brucellaceae bacterium]|nr:L,D-transpeptidase family protein [Brucellaceae bacterium]
MSKRRHLALLLVTLALPAMTGPASARTWLERFFAGELNDRRPRQEFERPAPKAKPRVIKKVSAPSYFRYVAPQPVAVDFSRVMNAPVAAAGMVLGGGADFVSARSSLEGYELTAEREDAAALSAWYAEHPGFLWVAGFGPNGKALAATALLDRAAEEGLEAPDYAVALPGSSFSMDDMPARLSELARFEMALSARYLRYMRDMTQGRVDPNKLSGYHDLPVRPFDPAKALADLSSAEDVAALMEAAGPRSAEYAALKAELATLRQSAEADIIVDPKLLLKPGQENPELAKLLALIKRDATPELLAGQGPVIDALQGATVYSDEAVALIKAVQKEKGLKPDGVIGPHTVAALSPVSKAERMDKVSFAMERLRWLPHELGARRVLINQAEFYVRYYENNAETLGMRVVVGKKSNQTSFFYDEIEQVDFNPYWGVPQSIIVNEMLPRLQRDPGYLDRAGYEVTDAKGRRVPSSSIDWSAHGGRVPYSVRQTPGEANALGELKILFPNKHAIYMHDTPSKSLFNRDMRAFSHGCVRLHNPRAMAAAVLGTSVDAVKQQLAKGHSSTRLPVKIPVYVAY